MIRYDCLFGHDEQVAAWVFERLGMKLCKPYRAIGLVEVNERDEARLVGGWVLNGYNGANVDLSLALEPGARLHRRQMRLVAHWIFDRLECTRVTARTRRNNYAMLNLLPILGFSPEGKQPRYYGSHKNDDAVVWGMVKENCPWYGDVRTYGRPRGSRPRSNRKGPIASQPRNGSNSAGAQQHQSSHAMG